MRHPLLALALGLVLGLGLGAALFSSPATATDPQAMESLRVEDAGPAAAAPVGETLHRSDPTITSSTAASPVDAQRINEQAARAVSRTAVPEVAAAAAGPGSLTVEVRDGGGQALSGVRLALIPYQRPLQGKDPDVVESWMVDDAELQRTLAEAAERWTTRRQGARFAVSDENGRATIDGLLLEQAYTLKSHKDDWFLQSDSGATYYEAGQHVVLLAEPVFRVPVELRLPDGSAPAAGLVEQRFDSSGTKKWNWRPDLVELPLRVGQHTLRGVVGHDASDPAAALGLALYNSEKLDVDVLEDGTTAEFGSAPVPLQLESFTSLAVTLGTVDPAQERLSFYVVLQPLPEGASVEQLSFDPDSELSKRLRRGQAASYLGLSAGTYALALTDWRGGDYQREVVEVQEGFNRLRLDVEPPDPDTILILRAEDPEGRVLRDVNLVLSKEQENSSSSGGVTSKTLPDGSERILMEPNFIDREPGTKYFLDCKHDDYGSLRIELVEGVTEYTARFEVPSSLTVRFENYVGNSIVGRLDVNLLGPLKEGEDRPRGYYRGSGSKQLEADGTCRMDTLRPGRYRLNLGLFERDNRFHSTNFGELEVTVLEGENFETVTLPGFHDVELHVPDVKPGQQLYLAREEGDGLGRRNTWGKVRDDYTVLFKDVAAGAYRLSSNNTEFDGDQVDVPCGVLTFRSTASSSLRVLISDESGRLASLGLRAGDWIIGVEGRGELSTNELFAEFRGQGSISLTVQRGEARVTIPVDLQATPLIGPLEELGGQLQSGQRP